MLLNFKSLTLTNIVSICTLSLLLFSCSSGAQNNNAEWEVEFVPANTTAGTYAALNVYSTKTGEFYQMYANEGQWKKNPNVPQPPVEFQGGDIRMEYMPGTLAQLPGLCIYSADTGQWKQYYLQKGEWIQNTNFPMPNVSLPKGDLRIDFMPGSPSTLAGLNVHCARTKQFEMFYLEDGEWKINPAFPTAKGI